MIYAANNLSVDMRPLIRVEKSET